MSKTHPQKSDPQGRRSGARRWLLLPALLMSALAGVVTMGLSPSALAQSARSAPQISDFYVESADALTVGSRLAFTLEGSPGASASVRIAGIAARVPLKETDTGVYEGSYTVKQGDRITATTTARATLKRRNRSTSSLLADSLGVTVDSVLPAPVPSPMQPGVLAIESLTVTPIDKLEAGADLDFTMLASPGGQASVTIEGVANPLLLSETKSGSYRGSYTLRRTDKIQPNARVTGTLVASGRTLRIALNQSLVVSATRPVIGNLSPANGEKLGVSESISVSGTFDDSSGGGIDPKSVVVLLAGRDVTGSTVITPQFFNYRAALEPGNYPVVVTAKNRAGNSVRQSWQFTVIASAASAVVGLPLEITSHQNMAQVVTGPIELRGRTAPDANVDIQVTSVSAIFGMFGLSQNLLTKAIRADANGNFSVSFIAPQMPSGGGRLQVALLATKGSQRQAQSLVLMQAQ